MRVKSRLLLLALLGSACVVVAADSWNAARWLDLFEQLPAPPATLAQAGAMVGPTTDDKGHPVLGITDAALLRSKHRLQAGVAAVNIAASAPVAAVTGIDMARMQRDPAYAAQMQKKMESMTQAEKMQMAVQMMAAQQAAAGQSLNIAAMRAYGALLTWVGSDGGRIDRAQRAQLRSGMQRIAAEYDARHESVDKRMQDLLKACPPIPRSSNLCGDTDCPPAPACIADLNARVPKLIADHRALASAELVEERHLFNSTRATLQPVLHKTAQLTSAVEAAGGDNTKTQAGYSMLMIAATQLQQFTALAVLRTGYWQNIRQRPIRDDYLVGAGQLGYHYALGDDADYAPPTDLPSGW